MASDTSGAVRKETEKYLDQAGEAATASGLIELENAGMNINCFASKKLSIFKTAALPLEFESCLEL